MSLSPEARRELDSLLPAELIDLLLSRFNITTGRCYCRFCVGSPVVPRVCTQGDGRPLLCTKCCPDEACDQSACVSDGPTTT